jgi:two-component system cell cycle sensor histidine kinase/response regulator CckA
MPSPTVWLDRITILVVDDEEPIRRCVSRMLQGADYHVLTAADGAHALSTLRVSRLPVQLVISDVCMPSMTGPELATRMALLPYAPPILFLSGGHAYADLPGPLLQKPFQADDLIRLSREILARKPQAAPPAVGWLEYPMAEAWAAEHDRRAMQYVRA